MGGDGQGSGDFTSKETIVDRSREPRMKAPHKTWILE